MTIQLIPQNEIIWKLMIFALTEGLMMLSTLFWLNSCLHLVTRLRTEWLTAPI